MVTLSLFCCCLQIAIYLFTCNTSRGLISTLRFSSCIRSKLNANWIGKTENEVSPELDTILPCGKKVIVRFVILVVFGVLIGQVNLVNSQSYFAKIFLRQSRKVQTSRFCDNRPKDTFFPIIGWNSVSQIKKHSIEHLCVL